MDEIFIDIDKINYKRVLELLANSPNFDTALGECESFKLNSKAISKIINVLAYKIIKLEVDKMLREEELNQDEECLGYSLEEKACNYTKAYKNLDFKKASLEGQYEASN